MSKLAVAFLVSFLFGSAGCSGCGSDYSTGVRSGVIVKFSRKGLLCKSWEGEVNLGGMVSTDSGSVPNVWKFHADESNAPAIEKAVRAGKPVQLHYKQWTISPWCQDSDYDVMTVEPVAP